MSGTYVKASNEESVYRGHVQRPGIAAAPQKVYQATFVDVRLTKTEHEFLVAAVEHFQASGLVLAEDREAFREVAALLERHGRLARWE